MKLTLSEILHRCMSAGTTQEILDIARQGLRSPLILADRAFQVAAITPQSDIDDPRWLQINTQRAVPLDIQNVQYFRDAGRRDAPVTTVDTTGLTIARASVQDRGRVLGYLFHPCYGGEPTPEELDIVRAAADLCCLRMERLEESMEFPENGLNLFLADLMNGIQQDEEHLLDRARHLNWNLRAPYELLSIRPTDTEQRGNLLLLRRYRAELAALFPEATVFQYGDKIRLLAPIYNRAARDALLQSELEDALRARGLSAGVSQAAHRLGSIARCTRQAEKALELGDLLHSGETLLFYTKYSVYHCLEISGREVNLLHCCHPAVTLLERYDRENDTEYLETLHAYLNCSQSAVRTAALLHIHRNTLTKRLDRIFDICSIDLSDSELVFHLQFSYHVLEYYGTTILKTSYDRWMRRSPTLRHK